MSKAMRLLRGIIPALPRVWVGVGAAAHGRSLAAKKTGFDGTTLHSAMPSTSEVRRMLRTVIPISSVWFDAMDNFTAHLEQPLQCRLLAGCPESSQGPTMQIEDEGMDMDLVSSLSKVKWRSQSPFKQIHTWSAMPRPCLALNARSITSGHRTSSYIRRNRVSYSSRRSLASHTHCTESDALPDIRNTVTTSLDGPDLEVYQSLMDSIKHLRLWLCTHGDEIDFRSIGLQQKMYTMPHTGTFHFILKKDLSSMDIVFDARNGWVYAVICPKGIFLFKDNTSSNPYIIHPAAHVLSFPGDYASIAPDSIEKLQLGIQSLRIAFDVLANFNGKTDTPEVRVAFGCLVVSISEAAKFHNIYGRVCTIMQKGGVETVEEHEPDIALEVKSGRSLGRLQLTNCIWQIRAFPMELGYQCCSRGILPE